MDTGQQRPDAQHEHRVHRRGQDPHPGLPGRIRPFERPADHRRDEERHEPVTAGPPTTCLDQFRLEREHAGSGEKNGDAKPADTDQKTLGYTLGGPVGKPGGTTSCSSSTRTSTGRRRPRSTAATRSGCGCRRRSSAPATSRRASTTTASRSRQLAGPGTRRHVRRTTGSRPIVSYSTGVGGSEPLPAAECDAGGRHQLQLRGAAPPTVERPHAAAGRPSRLPAVVEAARHRQVLGSALASARDARTRSRASPTSSRRIPYITNYAATVNYTMNPTTFIEGTYGFIRNELTGGNEGGILVNDSANRLERRWRTSRCSTRTPGVVDQRYYAYEVLKRSERACSGTATTITLPPELRVGRPHRRRAAEPALSRLAEHQPHAGRRRQLDQGRRAATPSRVVSTTTTASRRRTPAPAAGEPELPGQRRLRQRHEQLARHRVRLRQRGAGCVHALPQQADSSSKAA